MARIIIEPPTEYDVVLERKNGNVVDIKPVDAYSPAQAIKKMLAMMPDLAMDWHIENRSRWVVWLRDDGKRMCPLACVTCGEDT